MTYCGLGSTWGACGGASRITIGGGVFSRGARVRITSGGAAAGWGSRTSFIINGPGDGGVGGRTD